MEDKNTTKADQAAYWAAKAMSGALSDDERLLLDAWRLRCPMNQAAFDDFMKIGDQAEQAGDVLAAHRLERELEEFAAEDGKRRRWFVAAPGIAASIAIMGFFAASYFSPDASSVTYATVQGERADYTLADGSTVSLNTDSEITFSISDEERRVSLVRGEVMFDVERDVEKPFFVTTPTTSVSVLGTRFNVFEGDERAIVSVLSGVVQVAAANDTTAAPASTLIAGQQALIADDDMHVTIQDFNPDAVISWRRGHAFYENESLDAVVKDLNRYYPRRFELGNDNLKDIRVTGGFDLTDQAVAIEALTVALSLRADETYPNLILLYRDE